MALAIDPALPQADILTIKRMIPHRYPFLLIDRVVNIAVNRSAVGIKNVTVNEPHFQGHFPVLPVMPGVLIIEAMAQTSAVLVVETLGVIDQDLLVYFMSIDEAKFRTPVAPGDTLELHVDDGARPRQDLEVPRRGAGRRHALRRGGVRGDDPDRGRGEREGLRPCRSIRPPRSIRPRSSPTGAGIGAGCRIGPYCVHRPRGDARRRAWCCTATSRSPAGPRIGEATDGLSLRLDRPPAAGPEVRAASRSSWSSARATRIREHVTMNPGTAGGGGVTRVGDDYLFMMSDPRRPRLPDRQRRHHGEQRHARPAMSRSATTRCSAGSAAVHQFVRIGRGAMIGGLAGVVADVIPYGSVIGERAHLAGLNLVGLKRRGAGRDDIHGLRAAFAEMFEGEGTLQERARGRRRAPRRQPAGRARSSTSSPPGRRAPSPFPD